MESIHFVDDPCPLGCPECDEVVLVGRDLIRNMPGEFKIVKCMTCGLMRTNPRPSQDTISYYYPNDYRPYISTQVRSSADRYFLLHKIKSFAKYIVDLRCKKLPRLKAGRMLEIGCASGSFLHHMASKGWTVQGIEFSERAAQSASMKGYAVHTGPLETAPAPEESFDLFVGWMVLEHLYDPIGGLKKLRNWAKPGAWLVLSVPNAASLEFRLFKERWFALHLPNHLYHFTPRSLENVLRASGWKLEKVYYHRTLSSFVISLGYVISGRGYASLGDKLIDSMQKSAVWNYILYPFSWVCSVCRKSGGMTIWARINE